jgi:hypothetical protein
MPTPLYGTYAFQDITCSINGPGGNFVVAGPETAAAEEGISIAWGEESNTQTIGADGSVMNSMHSARAGTVTIRLLKTAPNNRKLQQMFHYQHQSSAYWGRTTITIDDIARGDAYTLLGCAFVRSPNNAYAKVGNILEYEFHVSLIDNNLGGPTQFGGTGTFGTVGAVA